MGVTFPYGNWFIDLFPGMINDKWNGESLFGFFPHFACLLFSTNTLSEKALKNSLACPCFKYFSMSTLQLVPEVFHSGDNCFF